MIELVMTMKNVFPPYISIESCHNFSSEYGEMVNDPTNKLLKTTAHGFVEISMNCIVSIYCF